MKFLGIQTCACLCLTLFGLLSGCSNAPRTAAPESMSEEAPTAATLAEEPAEAATPVEPQADDSEAVTQLKAAGVTFKLNAAGQAIEANCKPAQMTNELMPLLKGTPQLVSLDLENGQFENDALAVLEHLQNLKTINMRQCSKIDANGLAHLKKVPGLERLLLLYTRTNDAGLAEVASLKNLIVLDLRGTKIGDEGVNKLTNLTKLVDLKIRSTTVSGASMATIGKMTKLRYLALEDAGVGDDQIGELATLKGLVNFNIMRTYVSDEGLSHFADQKFQDLRLRDTAVSGVGLDALKGSIDSLTFLDLSETLIDNDGIRHIAPFKNLESLLVWNGTLDDAGLQPLTGLKKLKLLDIHGCRSLTTACAEHLLQMSNLEEINISETNLDDAGLAQLAGLKNLKTLSLGQTSVTSAGIEAFKQQRPNCRVNE